MHQTWPPQPEKNNPSERQETTEQFASHAGPPPPPPSAVPTVTPPENSTAETTPKHRGRFGWPTLVTSVALAAVLGGGAGGVAAHLVDTGSVVGSQPQLQDSPQLNRSENVTPTTQAAAVASPSVVTLSVGGTQTEGSGSGVILDEQGHILTNNHVVTLGGQTAAANVAVQTFDGKVYEAEVVGLDPLSDLAVIKISAEGLQPIQMGSAENLNVGDRAVAIGAPLGLSGTVTEGIISTLERTISVSSSAVPEEQETPRQESPFEFRLPEEAERPAQQGQVHLNVIQSDAAINPGNSGGALVDENGNLIGINVAIATRSEGNVGLGFAIPVDYAQRVAQELIEHGEASHGVLGVTIIPAGEQSISAGAQIVEVVEDGPAADTRLRSDDVITAVNGKSVSDPGALSATVREYPAGSEVELTVTRGQEEFTETVTLGGMN